jgi:hypothetical protein
VDEHNYGSTKRCKQQSCSDAANDECARTSEPLTPRRYQYRPMKRVGGLMAAGPLNLRHWN